MKIIQVDNFNRDTVDDTLIASHVVEYYAAGIVEYLNGRYSGERSPVFFKVVPDDYKLYKNNLGPANPILEEEDEDSV